MENDKKPKHLLGFLTVAFAIGTLPSYMLILLHSDRSISLLIGVSLYTFMICGTIISVLLTYKGWRQ